MYNLQLFVGITIWNCFDNAWWFRSHHVPPFRSWGSAGVSGTLRTAQGSPLCCPAVCRESGCIPQRGYFDTKTDDSPLDFGAPNFQKTQVCIVFCQLLGNLATSFSISPPTRAAKLLRKSDCKFIASGWETPCHLLIRGGTIYRRWVCSRMQAPWWTQ